MRCTVDVVLYHVLARAPGGRAERLVLRRAVFTELPGAGEVSVEELWTSPTAAHVHALHDVARGVAASARALVLGRPVAVPGLAPVTGAAVDELAGLADRAEEAGGVDRLLGFRGAVEHDALDHGDLLCASGGLLARTVRTAFRDVLAELGLAAGAGPADAPDSADVDAPLRVLDALRLDLRDARTRDEQQAVWEVVGAARLGAPVETVGTGPVFARWPRRSADGTTVVAPDGTRTDLDTAAVTFVEGDGPPALVRYRIDPRIDLRAVLRREAVRAAFSASAASGGGDPALRGAAVDALLAAGAPDGTDRGWPERRVDALGGEDVAWLGGTVVVTDCRGVQVGNHLRQYNTVTATVAPTARTAALLRDHPDLVESIVRYACLVDGPPRRDVQRSLHAAVCGRPQREPGDHDAGRTVGDVPDGDLVGAVSAAVARVVDAERRRVPPVEGPPEGRGPAPSPFAPRRPRRGRSSRR